MSFRVVLDLHGSVFTKPYHADTLGDLFNQIVDEFPKAKILSIIGGGS